MVCSDQFKNDVDNGVFNDVKLITGEMSKVEGYDVQSTASRKYKYL